MSATPIAPPPRLWLPLLAFAAGVVGLILIGIATYQNQRDQTRAHMEAQLRAIGEFRIAQVSRWLATTRAATEFFGQGGQVADHFAAWSDSGFKDPAQVARIQARVAGFQAAFGFHSVSLFDVSGQYRYSDHADPFMVQHEAEARLAMQRRASILIDFHRHGPGRNEMLLGMMVPLLKGQGEGARTVGAAFIAISPRASLFAPLGQWPAPSRSGETVLARLQGDRVHILFASRGHEPQDLISAQRQPHLASARILRGESGLLPLSEDFHGNPVLAYGNRIPGSPWSLLVKLDQSEVDAPVYRIALFSALGTASLVLLSGLFIGYWWRVQIRHQRVQLLGQEVERRILERRYDYLSRYASDVILLVDARGRIEEVNERVMTCYGYTPAEVKGQPVSLLQPPEARDEAWRADESPATGAQTYETEHQRKDGSRFPVEVTAHVIEIGGLTYGHLLFRDITQRKRVEADLRMQALVLDQIQDHVTVTDLNGVITYVNASEIRGAGYPREALIGQHVDILGNEPEADATQGEIARVTLEQGAWRGELVNVKSDGSKSIVDLRTRLVRDAAGKPMCMVGVGTDVTERIRAEQALQEREALYRGVIETSVDGFWVVDLAGRLLEVNDAYVNRSGYSRTELLAMRVSDLEAREDAETIRRHIEQVIATGSDLFETRHRCKDGSVWDVELNTSFSSMAGGRIFAFTRDIGQRKRAEERLRQAALVFDNTRDGIMITDARAAIQAVNPAFSSITGYAEAEVLGKNPRVLQSGRHDAAFYAALWSALLAQGHWSGEIWNRRKDGKIYPEWLGISAVRDGNGQTIQYIAVATDLSAGFTLQAKLDYQSKHSQLTGLPNVQSLLARIEQDSQSSDAEGQHLALLVFNIDRFAQLNETLGRAVGDQVLLALARRWDGLLGDDCLLTHQGADQFAVLRRGVRETHDAIETAAHLRDSMREPIAIDGGDKSVALTLSIGVALYPTDANEAGALLHAAEDAMRSAKADKGNQVRFYDQRQAAKVADWFETELALRGALAREEFFLAYQPQIDTASGRIVAAEALIRWRRGDQVVPPGSFIHVVEGTDLAEPVSRWVLHAACRQARQWMDRQRPLRVAVNIFSDHVTSGHLLDDVAVALASSGLPAHLLELEVVESSLLANPELAAQTLRDLKRMGVGLALDDFGTGYSSLGYLKHYPFDVLKIDQMFTRNVNRDPEDAAIVRSTIDLARNLGMRVLAEGVETESQLRFLARYGCDQLQGYLLCRPAVPEEVESRVMLRSDLRPANLQVNLPSQGLLLLEDDPVEAALLHDVLQDAGYRVYLAEDLDTALSRMGSEAIDLILSDHYLQHTTGVEILERIRRFYPEVPSIMLSGTDEQAVVVDAVNRAGIRVFLAKPVDADVLLRHVRVLLNKTAQA